LDRQEAGNDLQTLLKREQLHRHRLAICLDRSRFNLSLVEAPAVAPSEIPQALAWKVKDLIDYPLEQMVLDYVDVPATKSSTAMVYAVTSHEARIQELVREVDQVQGSLERIDIPALALQNLASRLALTDEGVALLNLTHRDSLLTLGRGEKLYLSRSVDALCSQLRTGALPAGQLQSSPLLDDLLLDIQRSLDYYDSYFVDPPIRHLIIPSMGDLYDELIDFLDQNLAVDVRRLDLEEVLVPGPELKLEGEYFGELTLAIGVAMWQQELAV
jgi:MSHA biogenesis protein MshI